MAGVAVGFLVGWFAYHFTMNRAIMFRECCLKHFGTHDICPCGDCKRDRDAAHHSRR
jgi:hypothetical protein